jgi:hypothetical protein
MKPAEMYSMRRYQEQKFSCMRAKGDSEQLVRLDQADEAHWAEMFRILKSWSFYAVLGLDGTGYGVTLRHIMMAGKRKQQEARDRVDRYTSEHVELARESMRRVNLAVSVLTGPRRTQYYMQLHHVLRQGGKGWEIFGQWQ